MRFPPFPIGVNVEGFPAATLLGVVLLCVCEGGICVCAYACVRTRACVCVCAICKLLCACVCILHYPPPSMGPVISSGSSPLTLFTLCRCPPRPILRKVGWIGTMMGRGFRAACYVGGMYKCMWMSESLMVTTNVMTYFGSASGLEVPGIKQSCTKVKLISVVPRKSSGQLWLHHHR